MISFIMMAYNVEDYIKEAIGELKKESVIKWELIVIDDHSKDETFSIVKNIAKKDDRITLVKNIAKGKVLGTNYGYSLTKGDIIKCIDSDDILKQDFFKEYEKIKKYDVHCHDMLIVDNFLNKISVYSVNPFFFNSSYEDVLNNLTSLPKCCWSFKRKIADKIFPMPENLPFEDVWMSIVIKKYAASYLNIEKPLYLYRQHESNTFGGVLNYDFKKVKFRANRLLKLVDIIKYEQKYLIKGINKPFEKINIYLKFQSEGVSIFKILKSRLSRKYKYKLILILYFPKFAALITRLKWLFDKV